MFKNYLLKGGMFFLVYKFGFGGVLGSLVVFFILCFICFLQKGVLRICGFLEVVWDSGNIVGFGVRDQGLSFCFVMDSFVSLGKL